MGIFDRQILQYLPLSFEGDRDHSSFPDVNFSQPIGLVLVSLGVRKRVGTGRKRKRQESTLLILYWFSIEKVPFEKKINF